MLITADDRETKSDGRLVGESLSKRTRGEIISAWKLTWAEARQSGPFVPIVLLRKCDSSEFAANDIAFESFQGGIEACGHAR